MRFRLPLLIALALSVTGCSILPRGDGSASEPASRGPVSAPPVATSAAERQCLARLADSDVAFTSLPDRFYGAGCQTIGTVSLATLPGDVGIFSLTNLGPVTCPLAESFAAWARFGVDRAARQILGSKLVRIETMGSYACRNIGLSTRRSAHASAEAIDVAAFVLEDGRKIALTSGWDGGSSDERRFLRVIHQSACKRFGTVLGPDYNAAHRDHFHLERTGRSFCR